MSAPTWQRHPRAAALVDRLVEGFLAALPEAAALDRELLDSTGSAVADWVDHLRVVGPSTLVDELAALGFTEDADAAVDDGSRVLRHPGAALPPLLVRGVAAPARATAVGLGLGVADAAAFRAAVGAPGAVEGAPQAPLRRAVVWRRQGLELVAVERRGELGFVPAATAGGPADERARERWLTRPRAAADVDEGLAAARALATDLAGELGPTAAVWGIFAAERDYWEQRNRAARVQLARQRRWGLGWANHDHHTFRCSRAGFLPLVQLLEGLGFVRRERFYAGHEAGWGAQVLEHRACGLVVFADVDLAPDELEGLGTRALTPRAELGTVGRWCALHGESILAAGMHHLALRLRFDPGARQLEAEGVPVMAPFSDLPHLRQAFTEAEMWPVAAARLEPLRGAPGIAAEELERVGREGAAGSHLEDIQRADGFKGFNQHAVSDIIERTDPLGA